MMLAEAGRKRRVGTEDMWTAGPFGSPFSSPHPSGLKGEVGGFLSGSCFCLDLLPAYGDRLWEVIY